MADYTSRAQVVISVNGKQAQKILADLENQAQTLRKKLDEASKVGDKEAVRKLTRELRGVERQMNQITGAAQSVEQVLSRLDKATPKELNKALNQLQRELNGIERGSSAWDEQMKKIQAVKAELQRVNSQMHITRTTAERINDAFNKWQMAIMGAVAALTGIIMAARKAVNAFAEMDEEMANTRKFTGMTEEEVNKLNDAFRAMDTRTARAELNQLAQEAGRLGKTTQEDVLGYVKAADIINVALSDLGEGATQKIAKLSNIFKIEDQYGTYDSMVKIGSVINVLSQNCTASKPYLVEFANRLAGVGNMAKVSLQNIIGMGAVLDANAQKVEASATAIGQVMTRMYREPAKYAKVAGLEIQAFTDLLKKDANEAFLQFLNALKNAGGMDVLAPMFKDMGENGARAITALATMAQHIDEVRSQQIEANKAFDEGKSVLHEYEIFNNTAQSSIDKAKKSVQELAIELGQKLYPAMKYVHSSTSVLMKVINNVVDFIIKFHSELAIATVAIASYAVAMNLTTISTKANAAAIVLHNAASATMNKILPVLRLMFVALQNAVEYFTNGLRVSYDMQNRWSNAMGAMSKANWAAVILTVASAVALLTKRFVESRKAALEAARENETYQRSLRDISKESAAYVADELKRLDDLYAAATSSTNSQHERIQAVTKLMELYPQYFTIIDEETVKTMEVKDAYDKLRASIIKTAEARGAQDKINELSKQLIEAKLWIEQNEDEVKRKQSRIEEARVKKNQSGAAASQYSPAAYTEGYVATPEKSVDMKAVNEYYEAVADAKDILEEKSKREKEIAETEKAIVYLEKTYGGSPYARPEDGVSGGGAEDEVSGSYTRGESEKEKKKRLAEERRRQILESKEFRAEWDIIKNTKLQSEAQTISEKMQGNLSYTEVVEENYQTLHKYYEDSIQLFKKYGLEQDDQFGELMKKAQENERNFTQKQLEYSQEAAKYELQKSLNEIEAEFKSIEKPSLAQTVEYEDRKAEARKQYYDSTMSLYSKGDKEYYDLSKEQEKSDADYKLRINELYQKSLLELQKKYAKLSVAERMKIEEQMIDQLVEKGHLTADQGSEYKRKSKTTFRQEAQSKSYVEMSVKEKEIETEAQIASIKEYVEAGVMTEKEGEKAIKKLKTALVDFKKEAKAKEWKDFSEIINSTESAWMKGLHSMSFAWLDFIEDLKGGSEDWITDLGSAMRASVSLFSSIAGTAKEFINAEVSIRTSKIEKMYQKERTLAEGNSYREKELEEKKEQEIAQIKSEAAKKTLALEVVQAVAQSATNAILGFGAGLKAPFPLNMVLPWTLMGLAVAEGAVQIALIKKQQQAAAASGYSSGGFTPDGAVDEPAGVVHAGEWVASQRLVKNPKIRPLLETLDQAQRTNSVGSLSMEDVSLSVAAPAVMAAVSQRGYSSGGFVAPASPQSQDEIIIKENQDLKDTLLRLSQRLESPIYAVTTMSGDKGIKKQESRYDRLIRNKR